MKILHLCSDYSGTNVYRDLIQSISKKSVDQFIYIPVRSKDLIDKYRIHNSYTIKYYYSHILKFWHRLLYYRKIQIIYDDVTKKINCPVMNIVHAHFLFSDGGVAYRLKKSLGLDYIVTIRNTDINVFFKYLVFLRKFGVEILLNARKIIFLSSTYEEKLLRLYVPEKYRKTIKSRIVLIPNGINNFWLENLASPKTLKKNCLNLLYVGEFSKNKNISTIIKVTDKLREKYTAVNLTLIGQYGDNVKTVQKMVSSRNEYVRSIPKINNNNELIDYYRNSDIFIMPSFYETFGLVYLEAMSQGTPVVYTDGQGFAGWFSYGEVGYPVSPENIDDIITKIEMIISKFDEISDRCIRKVSSFNWDDIASKIYNLYTMCN